MAALICYWSLLRLVFPRTDGALSGRTFCSSSYWEHRYSQGGNSGCGSYGRLAEFKAETINGFVTARAIRSVIEFGCGDGNQLALANYPRYLGFDVAQSAIVLCRDRFEDDKSKSFLLAQEYSGQTAELVLSLDVIYHLVEPRVFENYMSQLFRASTKYVVIYSTNYNSLTDNASHVRHRQFTDWIKSNLPEWSLTQIIPNRYPPNPAEEGETSAAQFFIYELTA